MTNGMRRWGIALAIAVCCGSGSAVLEACGDKFLMVGRGLAFGRAYASVFPGSILIYGAAPRDGQKEKLQQNIRRAGHKVAIVQNQADLSAKLQQTDIVIAELAMKPILDRQVAELASRPTVLYLIPDADKKRVDVPADAGPTVKGGEKPGRFLMVIEDIMKSRQQAGVRVKKS